MAADRKRRMSKGHGPVRLIDVAQRAGCSVATVSRALNNPAMVSDAVRERVRRVAAELGYLRNSAAGALRSRRTRTLGAVIPTLDHAIYARLVEALQNCAGEAGYSLLVTTSNFEMAREARQARLLVERGAEALVLVGHTHAPELCDLLASRGVPFVNTYTYRPGSDQPSVGFDNKAASAQVARFLLALGHRHFGLIMGFRRDNDRVNDRIDGAREALAESGIALPDSLVMEEPYTIEGGREGLRRLLQSEPIPSAVICGSDVLAFGALAECADRGIAVPRDISIAGFDDLDFAAHLKPALTTVRVPAAEMGRRAAEFLIDTLDGRPHATHCPLDTDLILRDSTAPPDAARAAATTAPARRSGRGARRTSRRPEPVA